MNKLKVILTTKDGIRSIFYMVMGLLIATIVAKHLPNESFSNIVVIFGSGLALVGTQSLVHMIITLNQIEAEKEKK